MTLPKQKTSPLTTGRACWHLGWVGSVRENVTSGKTVEVNGAGSSESAVCNASVAPNRQLLTNPQSHSTVFRKQCLTDNQERMIEVVEMWLSNPVFWGSSLLVMREASGKVVSGTDCINPDLLDRKEINLLQKVPMHTTFIPFRISDAINMHVRSRCQHSVNNRDPLINQLIYVLFTIMSHKHSTQKQTLGPRDREWPLSHSFHATIFAFLSIRWKACASSVTQLVMTRTTTGDDWAVWEAAGSRFKAKCGQNMEGVLVTK